MSGVGHYVRSFEIARELARYHEVYWVEGGKSVPRTPCPALHIISLPGLTREADGTISALAAHEQVETVRGQRIRILSEQVQRIRPHAMIVEYFPFSKWELAGELIPAISVDPTQNPIRISFIIEWANTAHHGVPRFWGLIDRLGRQWREMVAGVYPDNLESNATEFVRRFDARPGVLIVSGQTIRPDLEHEIHHRSVDLFDLSVHVTDDLEYQSLKNFGARLARGDILCFVDSDVHPDNGSLVHLLGSFSRPDVDTVMGQPYVKTSPIIQLNRLIFGHFGLVQRRLTDLNDEALCCGCLSTERFKLITTKLLLNDTPLGAL